MAANTAVRQRNRNDLRRALTIKDVAYALNCCQQTPRRLIERGQLRAFKVGTEYRVLPGDLDAYIQAQMRSA